MTDGQTDVVAIATCGECHSNASQNSVWRNRLLTFRDLYSHSWWLRCGTSEDWPTPPNSSWLLVAAARLICNALPKQPQVPLPWQRSVGASPGATRRIIAETSDAGQHQLLPDCSEIWTIRRTESGITQSSNFIESYIKQINVQFQLNPLNRYCDKQNEQV